MNQKQRQFCCDEGVLVCGGTGLGQLGSLQSLTFKDCSWLGDLSPNAPSWCPSLSGLTSLTELVFDHCPQFNTVPDAVRPLQPSFKPSMRPVCILAPSHLPGFETTPHLSLHTLTLS